MEHINVLILRCSFGLVRNCRFFKMNEEPVNTGVGLLVFIGCFHRLSSSVTRYISDHGV